jgi:hypothetical protein
LSRVIWIGIGLFRFYFLVFYFEFEEIIRGELQLFIPLAFFIFCFYRVLFPMVSSYSGRLLGSSLRVGVILWFRFGYFNPAYKVGAEGDFHWCAVFPLTYI